MDILLPIITRIINCSLSSARVPASFKIAAVTPILKRANLIAEILKNFRPISNLPFLSKILEKVASRQLISHKEAKCLRKAMQSAYREFYSTETALLYVQNDLLLSLDRKQCVAMVLIDLSAAFDTVNHEILLNRMSDRYGVKENALKWLKSYLTNRKQFITIKGARSDVVDKHCDVPQGSVLGPNLYEDYTASPLGDIFRRHGVSFHIYADDTQIYVSFLPGEEEAALTKLENCLEEVRQWMAANWLQLNDSKTEFIIFGSSQNLCSLTKTSLTIGQCVIDSKDTKSVKSLGAHFDINMNLDTHLSAICKSGWYHLYQISKIRSFLTTDQTKSVVHAYVTSRLDQHNSLLLGLSKQSLKRLQFIQNAAAKLIIGAKKRDHVTPILISLHWLPVEQRILFKILLLTFKTLQNKGPSYLKEHLTGYTPASDVCDDAPAKNLRSGGANLLCLPQKIHYSTTKKRAFCYRAPKEWNMLPVELKNCKTIANFKVKLKTYLFRVAFY